MDNQQLINTIKKYIQSNLSKEDIYKNLLTSGVSLDLINQYYPKALAELHPEDHSKKIINLVLSIGAILIGIGILSFFAANWQEMGKVFKLFLIIFVLIITNLTGWYLWEYKKLEKTGRILIFLGSIIYGAGIFLIGQIFNVSASWPDGFILWMIGAVIMAYAIDFSAIYYLSLIAGVVAIFSHPFLMFDSFTYTASSSWLLILSAIVCFLIGLVFYKKIPLKE